MNFTHKVPRVIIVCKLHLNKVHYNFWNVLQVEIDVFFGERFLVTYQFILLAYFLSLEFSAILCQNPGNCITQSMNLNALLIITYQYYFINYSKCSILMGKC